MKRNIQHTISSNSTFGKQVNQGLILIPDISGYSEFVEKTDIEVGRSIVYELLSEIIQANTLGLEVSEVEGDAVLFYKYGKPPSIEKILEQFERMLKVFHNVLSHLHTQHSQLSLKMIAHYGPITEFQINRFRKLYVEPLIIAHRLLKNSIDSTCYVLLTDDLLNAAPVSEATLTRQTRQASKLCQVYGNLKEVCFTYFDYQHDSRVAEH
jgi:hypothetical protein